MAEMNTVMGGVGTGVQPKDNPDPSQANPSAAAQTATNSLPTPNPFATPGTQQGQTQAAPPQPQQVQAAPTAPEQPKTDTEKSDDKAVSDLMQSLSKDKGEKEKESPEVQAMFDELGIGDKTPIVEGPQKGESFLDYATRDWSQKAKFVAAQMRAHLDDDPKNKFIAFESQYGKGNVKNNADGSMSFRPDADSKFRKIDQTVIGPVADYVLFRTLSGLGMGAGMAAGAGAAALSEGGALANGASGAVAGATQSLVNSGMKGLLNAGSAEPQDMGDPVKDAITKTILGGTLGVVVPPVAGAMGKAAGSAGQALGLGSVMDKAANYMESIFGPESSATAEDVGNAAVKRAQDLKSNLMSFKKTISPGFAPEEEEEAVGQGLSDAVVREKGRLDQNLNSVKDEIRNSVGDKKVDLDNTLAKAKELTQFTHKVDPSTGALIPLSKTSAPYKQAVMKSLDDIATYHNNLLQNGSKMDFDEALNAVTVLQKNSRFDDTLGGSAADVADNWAQLQSAARTDRDNFATNILKGKDSDSAASWQNAYDNYHQRIDAISKMGSNMLHPEKSARFVDNLIELAPKDRAEALDTVSSIVGRNSESFKNLQGALLNHHLDDFVDPSTGAIQADKALEFFAGTPNRSYLSKVMEPEEQSAIKQALISAKNQQMGKPGLVKGAAEAVVNYAAKFTGPVGTKLAYTLTNGSKDELDHYVEDVVPKLASEAVSPQAKQSVLNFGRLLGKSIKQMQVVSVPASVKGAEAFEKYIPGNWSGTGNSSQGGQPQQ